MNELVTLIKENGIGLVLMAYFLLKDYRFTTKLENYMSELTKFTAKIEEHLEKNENKGDEK